MLLGSWRAPPIHYPAARHPRSGRQADAVLMRGSIVWASVSTSCGHRYCSPEGKPGLRVEYFSGRGMSAGAGRDGVDAVDANWAAGAAGRHAGRRSPSAGQARSGRRGRGS
jgi:hypothetical protein